MNYIGDHPLNLLGKGSDPYSPTNWLLKIINQKDSDHRHFSHITNRRSNLSRVAEL
jgi:hypothetical protein